MGKKNGLTIERRKLSLRGKYNALDSSFRESELLTNNVCLYPLVLASVYRKGELQTYWLTTHGPKNLAPEVKLALPAISKFLAKAKIEPAFCEKPLVKDGKDKLLRLVEYNTKVMERLLKRIVATRGSDDQWNQEFVEELCHNYSSETIAVEANKNITFPLGNTTGSGRRNSTGLGPDVVGQLHTLVTKVASSYRDLPFHCFEHASHTILTVTKLLASMEASLTSYEMKEVLSPDDRINKKVCEMLTHPLAQFTLVFAALVHDVEYEVPNIQLMKEGSDLAKKYSNKSCAEQNSINAAW